MQQPAEILKENEWLRIRLQQTEDVVRAFRGGDVDALAAQHGIVDANWLGNEILAQVADAVIAVDESDRIIYLNVAAELLYGLAESYAFGRLQADVFTTPWIKSDDEAAAAKALREQGEWCSESVHLRHDGRELSVECRITARKDNKGLPDGRVAVIRDVSKRKQHEKGMLLSENRYRRLFEAAHDGVLIVDPETRKIVDANPFMIKLLGYPLADLADMEIFELGFLGDAQAAKDMFQSLKATGQVRYENLPLQTEDGAPRFVEVVANCYNENGHSVIQLNVRDITERMQAQKALADSDNRFRLALENSPITVFEQDLDLRYTWIYNPKLGFTVNSVIGTTDAEIMEASVARQLTTIKRGVLQTGQSVNREVTAATPGKTESHFDLTVEPRRGSDGQIEGIICAAVDITEQKHAEDALRESEALQAFLLKFSDALRHLGDPVEVQTAALRVLGEHFGAVRAQYWQVEPDGQHAHSEGGYTKEGPSVSGRVRLNDYGVHVIKTLAAGLKVMVSDMATDPLASKEVLAAYDAVGVRSFITVPLVKGGRLVALFTVHHAGARDWTTEETVLIDEAAERTWAAVERAQAEAALRESELRLRTLFDNMAEGFALFDVVRGPTGQITDLLYREANRALEHQTGFDRAKTIGRTLKEILTPSDAARFIPLLARAVDPGESGTIEEYAEIADRWFEVSAYPHGPEKVAAFYRDISERKRAEIALRESEARQAFLLRLSDAVRAEPNTEAIMDRALRMLFDEMQLDRCYVGIYRLAEDTGEFPHQIHNDSLPPLPAHVRLSDFPEALQVVFKRTHVSDDIAKMAGLSDSERASFTGLGIGAMINATLRKGENNPLWAIVAVSASPRIWTMGEVSLVEEVAERTWAAVKRARAKDRLQIAHDTFRNLIDRSPFGTYIVDADFRLIQISDGGKKAFANVRPLIGRDFAEAVRAIWLDPFSSEVIERFRHTLATGEPFKAVTNERRADIETTEAYDWQIERMVLPDGRLGVVCHFYDFSEKQQQEDRIKLLMGEVNHRSKNMLGLIQAIAKQTVKTQPEDFLEIFGQRVRALSASQDLLVKGEWKAVQLGELVRSQLAHFGDALDGRITINGPLVKITASASQTLGMAVHELATNAAKFGALSNESGRVVINWSLQSDVSGQEQFAMSWIESGGPSVAKPARRGFGSTVIDGMLKMSLGCDAEVNFAPTGLVWRIGCPAAGLIESDVPPAPRLNGTAAVQEPEPVSGRRVLIVEDEPLIAMDFSQALSDAGYVVIGPANSVARALALLAQFGCDAAVLDVNLGMETSEPVARELIKLGTPFVVTSGYSREQQPEIMQSAPLLGKPASAHMLLAQVERCLGRE
ncbi:PAS domain S-box protein [Cypionkella sp. TWP1-2-1b2]|uniref:PAS domain S-box protein n=1 Tax=Cypionkella sp. TWP1-2-1b2 TaxID=2804675 RepID=UPI003CF99E89